MRRSIMLDLVLTSRERLMGNIKLMGSLDCGQHEMVEFKTLREEKRGKLSMLKTLSFSRAASLGTSLLAYHGTKPWWHWEPKEAG